MLDFVLIHQADTDISVAKGLLPGSDFPVILGHEGSGRVVSTGSKVTNV